LVIKIGRPQALAKSNTLATYILVIRQIGQIVSGSDLSYRFEVWLCCLVLWCRRWATYFCMSVWPPHIQLHQGPRVYIMGP